MDPEIIFYFNFNICQGPRHTQYFCRQCIIKRLKNILIKIFFSSKYCCDILKYFKLGFKKHNCPKINVFNSLKKKKFWMKNVFLSFYCNIFFYLNIVCKNIVCELGLCKPLQQAYNKLAARGLHVAQLLVQCGPQLPFYSLYE